MRSEESGVSGGERFCPGGSFCQLPDETMINNNVYVLCLTSYYLLALRIQHAQPYLHCFTLNA